MSKNSKGFVGVSGVWRPVLERHVGVGGVWKKQMFKFVGDKGRWRLVFNDTPINVGSGFYVEALQNYQVTRGNNFYIYGDGFLSGGTISPQTGAYYLLEGNTNDSFGNFIPGIIVGTASYATLDGLQSFQITNTGDYFHPSTEVGGFTSIGITGNTDGGDDYTMGLWFYIPSALTLQRIPIFSFGTRSNGMDVYVGSDLSITQAIYTGTTTNISSSAGVINQGQWNSVVISRELGDTKIRVNGNMTPVAESATATTLVPTDSPFEIRIGSELTYTETTTAPHINPAKTHNTYTLTNNDLTLSKSTINNYENARGINIISINSGKYYWEVSIDTTGESNWIGIAEPTSPISDAVGIAGWSASSLSRTFDREAGGGTIWGGGSNGWTTGDVIGVIYDSDAATVTYYKNNVLIGTPAFTGITGDVEPMFAGVNGIQLTAKLSESDFTYAKPGDCQVLPSETTFTNPTISSIPTMAYKNVYLRGAKITDANISTLLQVGDVEVVFNDGTTDIILEPQWEVSKTSTALQVTIPPNFLLGDYNFFLRKGGVDTLKLPLKVSAEPVRTSAFVDDFSNPKSFNNNYLVFKRQWGGANGGVIPENVYMDGNEMVFRANGDRYTGNLQGVNQDGSPKTHTDPSDPEFGNPWTHRVGGCVSLNKKTGFGSYEVEALIPNFIGTAYAFWTFFYNEIYEGDPRYSNFTASPTLDGSFNRIGGGEGLHVQGDVTNYVVRNHEIDIELPSNAVGNPVSDANLSNVKLNSWRGELKNTEVPDTDPAYWEEYSDKIETLGFSAGDGSYHKYRFDWYHDRVEFYVDDVLKTTTTNGDGSLVIPDIAGFFTMGVWFPSAPLSGSPWLVDPATGWAGGVVDPDGGLKADFDSVEMRVRKVTYTPFSAEIDTYLRREGETYPFVNNVRK